MILVRVLVKLLNSWTWTAISSFSMRLILATMLITAQMGGHLAAGEVKMSLSYLHPGIDELD